MAKRQRSVDPPLAPLLPFWEDSSSCVLGILDLSPEAKFQLELLWTLLDVKRDGFLTLGEMQQLLRPERAASGLPISAETAQRWEELRRALDGDADGRVSTTEFVDGLQRLAMESAPADRAALAAAADHRATLRALQSSVNASVQNLCQQLVVSLGALDQTAVAAALARVRAALARSGSPAAAEALLVRGGAAAPAGETAAQALASARQHLKELQPAAPAPASCSAVSQEWLASVYDVGDILGEGSFGTVKLIEKRATGEKLALKQVWRKLTDADEANVELLSLRRAGRHAHIVSLVDAFELPDAFALVLDLCTGGEVFEALAEGGPFSESAAAAVVRQTALALEHLHCRGVIHRDLKPENLLLTSRAPDALVKLADFGVAALVGDGDGAAPPEGQCGTPAYFAPEMLLDAPYGREVDLWALGVVLFNLLSARDPFAPRDDGGPATLEARIAQGVWSFAHPGWRLVSAEAKTLVRSLLEPDATKRPTAAAVAQLPWVELAAPHEKLAGSDEELRRYNEGRKVWRAATNAVSLLAACPAASAAATIAGPLSAEAEAELRAAFDAYDVNQDGQISLQELERALRALGCREAQSEARRIMAAADGDKSGAISFAEFAATARATFERGEGALRAAFALFDADANGFIDRSEFSNVVSRPGVASGGSVDKMFAAADADGDGRVSFQEFAAAVGQARRG